MSEKKKKPSNRQTWLFLTDFGFFISMAASTFTGVLLWLFIGKGGSEDKYLWSLHRHEWGDIHLYLSIFCVILLSVHFIQHWRWIRSVAPRQAGPATGFIGIARLLLVSVVILGVTLACFFVFRGDVSSYGQGGAGRLRHGALENAGTHNATTPTADQFPRGRGGGRQGRGGRGAAAPQEPFSLTPNSAAGNLNPAEPSRTATRENGYENSQSDSPQPRPRRWRGGRGR